MRKEVRSSTAAPRGYLLPVSAHRALLQTRDQLRLLAQLTETPEGDRTGTMLVSHDALADLFDHIADDLDEVMDEVAPQD